MLKQGLRPGEVPEDEIAKPEAPMPNRVAEPNFDKPEKDIPDATEVARALASAGAENRIAAGFVPTQEGIQDDAEVLATKTLEGMGEKVEGDIVRPGAFVPTPAVSRPWTIGRGAYRATVDANRTQDSSSAQRVVLTTLGAVLVTAGTAFALSLAGIAAMPLALIAGGAVILTAGAYVVAKTFGKN